MRAFLFSIFTVCIAGGLCLVSVSCKKKEVQAWQDSSQALGAVLAEETAKAAGNKKEIALISPTPAGVAPSKVQEAFESALKKKGYSITGTKTADVGDPMRPGPVGLKAADFFEALEKFSQAGAVVSLAGPPMLKPGEESRSGSAHPPILVVATASLGNTPGFPGEKVRLAEMVDAGLIQSAIVDGAEPAAPAAKDSDSTRKVFNENFRILRKPE